MTMAEVTQRVEAVRAAAERGDFEAAHVLEDALYRDALQVFANEGFGLALIVLKTQAMTFERHCV